MIFLVKEDILEIDSFIKILEKFISACSCSILHVYFNLYRHLSLYALFYIENYFGRFTKLTQKQFKLRKYLNIKLVESLMTRNLVKRNTLAS